MGGADDRGTKGPEPERGAGAPRGVGYVEGRRSPSQYWGVHGSYAPRNFFKTINIEIAHFVHFCDLKCSHLQCLQGFRLGTTLLLFIGLNRPSKF